MFIQYLIKILLSVLIFYSIIFNCLSMFELIVSLSLYSFIINLEKKNDNYNNYDKKNYNDITSFIRSYETKNYN